MDASRRLFLGNFDFEAALVDPSAVASRNAERRNSELAFAWLAIARPGDVIVTDLLPGADDLERFQSLGRGGVRFARLDDKFDSDLEPTPWGWDERALRWAGKRGLQFSAPPLHAVARANSRLFSVELEQELGCGLDGQAVCRSLDDVHRAVARLERWLIKANFGAAGRERISGSAPLSANDAGWLERRIARDGVVLVEPFVNAIAEAGIQWDIPQGSSPPSLIGVVPLRSDARGQYVGSGIANELDFMEPWREAIELAREAAVRVQRLGYFGPLGIDAMRYRDERGDVRVRALQDINARWTMGRLSLGWRDRVPRGNSAFLRSGPQQPDGPSQTSIRISPYPRDGHTLSHVFFLDFPGLEAVPPRN